MPTLEAIQMKIKRLQEQAEAMKAKQASATLDRIAELMQKSGVTVADIEAHIGGRKRGAGRRNASAAHAAPATAKYQNPKTGATWSGRGRAPAWIAHVKNRSRFLVDGNASSSSVPTESKAKRRGNYVRGEQPAKYRDPKTGDTWSGRGRAPAWIANAKDRSKFSIGADGKVDAAVKSTPGKAKNKLSSTAASPGRKGQPKGKQPAKYLNPETGATWSGRGPAPAWLAAASDRSKFLTDSSAADTPTA
ncbi:H-NS family nucleoid-associated regulatory protein [Burkholderia sp. Bp9142]|uniref:H-NS family nucleoid-associated regulatory protein n=1 Tax=Burkholderia sp. Bp9142 TaxID=2184573 RepID=UPI000F595E36|nr:H-NS family nucleoid-associated regulatory protein [Burkholderia sp. Bp9142]RQR34839.1 H-NS histone family protein [Burkholderia sp. Bp9142]